ncbi:MAG: hypothetical protein QXV21_03065 [Candidatus Bathyarchaeia archaeon]
MRLFSQRKGLKKDRIEIQIDSMDDALRNRLWNVFEIYYINPMIYGVSRDAFAREMETLMIKFFDSYLKEKVDDAPSGYSNIKKFLCSFFSMASWYAVYDFLEFIVTHFRFESTNEKFMETCNNVLESELSAYRFVGKQIAQVTSKEEISEIEEALESPFKTVNIHLEEALKLMSDKKSPNYRNSIKESISAVEAICRIIANDKNATLGKALNIIEKKGKIELHKALKDAFDHLYGYTSSAEGIRHSLLEEKVSLNFEDAKFMLVSCSAFINYLISKAVKAGIKIGN